nr:hypothetical protein [Tanacetum cinerariifolium]
MFEIDTEDDAQSSNDEDEEEIKWADLIELVKETCVEAMDLDSPEDDQPLQISSDDEANIQAKFQNKTDDTLLTELLVNSLKPELDKMLTAHDSSASIRIELKELPTKVNEISGTLGDLEKYVEQLDIEVTGELKDLPNKLQDFQASISVSSISSQLTKPRVLDAIPSMLGKVADDVDRFANAIDSASQKAGDQRVS